MKCAVVVDRASLEFRLRDLAGTSRRSELDLARVVTWFRCNQLEPVEVAVAGPSAVWAGPGSKSDVAGRWVRDHRRWCAEQASQLARLDPAIRFRELWGATNGKVEVGVDVVAAAGALDAASRVESEDVELVIVMSGDSDLHRLHSYVTPVRLLLATSFTANELELLQGSEAPFINIPDDDLLLCRAGERKEVTSTLKLTTRGKRDLEHYITGVEENDVVLVHRHGSGSVVSSPLNRPICESSPAAASILPECRTIAAVDPYGMFGLSMTSLGDGHLPTAESVRETLASLGWDGPFAVLATIPDIEESSLHGVSQLMKLAWWNRDSELDELADDLDEDGDERTVSKRATLRVDRLEGDDDLGLVARTEPSLKAKGLAVGLLADLWLAQRCAPDVDVVLVSEHVDLVTALTLLPLSGITTYRSVVRIGVHEADQLEVPYDHPGTDDARPLGHVLLVDAQLAALCGVADRVFGGAHRQLLFHGVRGLSSDNRARFIGLDPETEAHIVLIRVHFDADGDGVPELHRIKSLAFGVPQRGGSGVPLSLPNSINQRKLTIVFDHQSPCAHPVLMYRESALEGVEGIVRDQDGNWISVDIDEDGAIDTRVPVGHEALDFDPGRDVVLGEVLSGHVVVDPGHSVTDQIEPEVVRVVGVQLPAWEVRALEDDVSGPLLGASGEPYVDVAVGDLLFALRRESARGPEFVALSTPLAHLAELVGDR